MLGPSTSPIGIPRSVIENALSFNGSDVNFNGNVGIGGLSSTSKLNITDTVLAGSGSLNGSVLGINQTWNTTGTPTAIKLDVTDTASNANSLLMDLRVGGSSRFNVRKDGRTSINGDYTIVQRLWINNDVGFMSIGSASAGDVQLWRDATNIFAQRRSTNAQEFRLYNTYTDASNYERLSFKANTGGAYTIASEAAGTGSVRDIALMGGNVGIGTNTPTKKLDVSGDVKFTNGTFTKLQCVSQNNTWDAFTASFFRLNVNSTLVFSQDKGGNTGLAGYAAYFDVVGTGSDGHNGAIYAKYVGTGNIVRFDDNAGVVVTIKNSIVSNRDVEITDTTKGVILKSPNGTRWRITVDDTGALTSTAL